MKVIATISCYFERSVVTEMAQRIFKYNCTSLTPDKILHSLIYRTLYYVNIYTEVTNFQKTVRFLLAHPVHTHHIYTGQSSLKPSQRLTQQQLLQLSLSRRLQEQNRQLQRLCCSDYISVY